MPTLEFKFTENATFNKKYKISVKSSDVNIRMQAKHQLSMIKLIKAEIQIIKDLDLKALFTHLKYNPNKKTGSEFIIIHDGAMLKIWSLNKAIGGTDDDAPESHLPNMIAAKIEQFMKD